MPSDEPLEDRCGAECKQSDGYCTQYPVSGSERCRIHGGKTPTKEENPDVGNGDQDGNGNAETYSLRSDPGKYYERQSDAEQDRIDEWAGSWARRGGYDGLGFDKLFHTHAIKLHQIETADEAIEQDGVIVSRVVDRTEAGEPIVKDEEHAAFLLQGRALKDLVRFLKDFGCLDDPDTQQAEATESVAAMLGDSS